MRIILLAPLLALALAGCLGGGDRDRDRQPRRDTRADVRPSSRETQQCLADLSREQVRFNPLPDRAYDGGCSAFGAVQLLDIGTPTTNLGAMTCPLARSFAAWVRNGVVPAARLMLGSELVRIESMGTYSCRRIAGSGRISEHGRANAVDVGAFVLADGRRIRVAGGWTGGSDAERAFLRRVHQSACRRFGTVLGPDYNAAHRDHLHLDLAGRAGAFCR